MKTAIAHPSSSNPLVVHLVTPYLFHTGTWVYSQITQISKFRTAVFTQKKQNMELFPFERVYSPDDFGYFEDLLNKIYRRLTDNYGLFFGGLIRSIKPRLFHAHMGYEGARWLPLLRRCRIPLVTAFYGLDASQLAGIARWRKRYAALFEYGSAFLVEGTHLQKQLLSLGCSAEKVVVQHLGVPVNEYPKKSYAQGTEHSRIVILQVSTFREKKGIEYSLRSLAQVVKEYPAVEFRLIGGGDTVRAELNLRRMIDDLRVKNFVKLLGVKSHRDTLTEMAKADIFLHPSVTASNGDNEGGAPVSIIEASAVGLPVVSTIHADIPEVVINGKTGLLVPERDAGLLAEELLGLIQNPSKREKFGKAARKHIADQYNLAYQVQKLEHIYRNILNA